jgi:hypothetical protein
MAKKDKSKGGRLIEFQRWGVGADGKACHGGVFWAREDRLSNAVIRGMERAWDRWARAYVAKRAAEGERIPLAESIGKVVYVLVYPIADPGCQRKVYLDHVPGDCECCDGVAVGYDCNFQWVCAACYQARPTWWEKRRAAVKVDKAELGALLGRLLAWADNMGGWEAPVWDDARRAIEALEAEGERAVSNGQGR